MKRTLALVGTFVLAAMQPAVTLGAPRAGSAAARPAAPVSRAADRGGSLGQDGFKIPSHLDMQPKALAAPYHFAPESSARIDPQALPLPYRRYGWQTPGYLWYPALYGPACTGSSFLGSPSQQQPSDFTIGSLVDGKSSLLSSQAHDAGFSSGNAPSAVSSSSVTLGAGVSPAGCGSPSFANF